MWSECGILKCVYRRDKVTCRSQWLRGLKANPHIPCRAHAFPLPCRAAKGLDCVLSHLIYTVRPCLVHTWHAAPVSCHDHAVVIANSQGRGMGMACHVWISIGRSETACGRPARFRLLPATTRSYTKVVIRSIPIRYTVGLAVRIFPATTRTFTKDTALSGKGRGAVWHVWISLKAWVCGRSLAGVASSNPTGSWMCLLWLCVVR
jgi:hypothetical protein